MPIKRENLSLLSYIKPSRIKLLPNLITKTENHILKNQLFVNEWFSITIKETTVDNFKYNYNNQTINLENNKNSSILKSIQMVFPKIDNAFQFILYHEIGHAVQHSSLYKDSNPIQDSEIEPFRFYNKHYDYGVLPDLNRLFSKMNIAKDRYGNNIPSFENIHYFMRHNLNEAYADLYAGYALYLQNNNDITIFDKIKEYRQKDFLDDFKKDNPHKVSRYQNISAITHFKEEISGLNKEVKFEEVHQRIQKCILKGLVDTLIQEYKNNPAFRNDFNHYTQHNPEKFFINLEKESKSYQVLNNNELSNIIETIKAVPNHQNDNSLHINNVNNYNNSFFNISIKALEKCRNTEKQMHKSSHI